MATGIYDRRFCTNSPTLSRELLGCEIEMKEYVPLPCGLVFRIELTQFEIAEQCFDWSRRVGIRSGEDQIEAHCLSCRSSLFTGVVRGVVPKKVA